ncbi:MAG: electron transfer flavoprotein subunit alpha/FixB family protein [Magnetococcales bacterium]|nr:electron transfer flavoprotein subunit alpha/FixB family protein [Magnetococcales bacterium]
MSVLMVIDAGDPDPVGVAARLMGAVRGLEAAVSVLVVGVNSREVACGLARLAGIREVIHAHHPAQRVPPEDLAQLVVELAAGFDHLVATAGSFGAELMPRIGGILRVSPVTGVVEMRGPETFVRSMHAGRIMAVVRTRARPVVLTVQPWAFAPVPLENVAVTVRQGPDAPTLGWSASVDFRPSNDQGNGDLSTARVVVAGGAGLEKEGSFASVERLARVLGGAVGASRGAVDAGLAPAERQIGQTGRIIAPEVYIALGISGAVQHLAGVKEAGCLVSINIDPQAPMALVADLALTGDLHTAVPALIEALQSAAHPSSL